MQKPLSPPKFRFYATLLNSYQWYLDSSDDEAFQDFINTINRVPFQSEAADKGIAFNELVDMLAFQENPDLHTNSKEQYVHNGFNFPFDITQECAEYVRCGTPQIRESGFIETLLGFIEVYGDIDYVLPMEQVDLKTTAHYEMGKYLRTWQHIAYPYCYYQKTEMEPTFTYLVTDFKNVVKEQYHYNHERDSDALKSICVDLAQFIEQHRDLITDTKIFKAA